MSRPAKYWSMVEASASEAELAARLYNDPAEVRSFESFVVHMHLAWLYLLHAEFTKEGKEFRYRRKDSPRFFEKIDGQYKHWELSKCVSERWEPNNPVRRNIEFFIGLRNNIEHRCALNADLALSTTVGGHAQAFLLNYEEELVEQFGEARSLATRLRFPVFVGTFTDAGEITLRRLSKALPKELKTWIAEYATGLPTEVKDNPKYELRLRVVQDLVKKDDDALPVQFTRYEELTEEQKAVVEEIGRKGFVIVRSQTRPVSNLKLMKPATAAQEVKELLPYTFKQYHFYQAWKKLKVRPDKDSANPEMTDERYCVYDEMNDAYGYTKAYVQRLVRELDTPEKWRKMYGVNPQDKETGEIVE